MKKTFYSLLFIIQSIVCCSQTMKHAVVLDALNNTALEKVCIFVSTSKNQLTLTNTNGKFQIKVYERDSIKISHMGYNKAAYLAKNLPDTIYLLKEDIPLTGVIISANAANKILKTAISNLAQRLASNNVSVMYDLYHTDSIDDKLMRTCSADMLLHIKGQRKNRTLKIDWNIVEMKDRKVTDSLFFVENAWLNDEKNLNTIPPFNVMIEETSKYDKQLLYEFESVGEDSIVIHTFPKSKYRDKFVESYSYISAYDTILLKNKSIDKRTDYQNLKLYRKNSLYKYYIVEQNGIYSFKDSQTGYYLDYHSFYMKYKFLDADFDMLSQYLEERAVSAPIPYKKEHKSKLNQHKVWASSYLFNYKPFP